MFVRKSKLDKESDAKKFYFLEGMRLIEKLKTVKKPTGEKGKVISYADGKFVLENEVRNDIYEYLQADLEEKK